jgi:hypothetical protein
VGSHVLRGIDFSSVSTFLLLNFRTFLKQLYLFVFFCCFFLHFIDNLVVFKKNSVLTIYVSATPFEKMLLTFNIDNFTAIR